MYTNTQLCWGAQTPSECHHFTMLAQLWALPLEACKCQLLVACVYRRRRNEQPQREGEACQGLSGKLEAQKDEGQAQGLAAAQQMEKQAAQGQGRKPGVCVLGGWGGGISPEPLLTAAGQDGDGEELQSQARSERGRNPGPESGHSSFLQFQACCSRPGLIIVTDALSAVPW